jgi:nucleotide-binding universal stress UspA family protein
MLSMPEGSIQTIAHATDFSEASAGALAHALRLALATKSRLLLLHVGERGNDEAWLHFPHMRQILARWGLMDANEPPSQIELKLGVQIRKVEIKHRDPTDGLFTFVLSHRPDLMVLATHGREGLNRWLRGSVAEDVARRTHVPTLFFGPKAQGCRLCQWADAARILVPVTHKPSPKCLCQPDWLLTPLGVPVDGLRFSHRGQLQARSWRRSQVRGEEVGRWLILQIAQRDRADSINCNRRPQGFLDALQEARPTRF